MLVFKWKLGGGKLMLIGNIFGQPPKPPHWKFQEPTNEDCRMANLCWLAKIFGQTSPLHIAARPINFNPLTPHIFPLTHKTSLLDFDRTRTLFHPVVKIQSRISDSSVVPHLFVLSYMTHTPKTHWTVYFTPTIKEELCSWHGEF